MVDKNSSRKGLEGIEGTLEALASGYGLADIARDLAKTDNKSILYSLSSDDIEAKEVFDAAKTGDLLANEIIDSAVSYISIGIDTLVKLFNTECIVLSGGLVQNGDIFIDKIREELKKYSFNAIPRSVPVRVSGFGETCCNSRIIFADSRKDIIAGGYQKLIK